MQNIPQDADKIIGFINEIGEEERHFNVMSSNYKSMASTWLLAVFGAVGFILGNAMEPRLLLTAGIGLAGGVGIYLLWLIDIRVYQQLVAANFSEGLRLEKENKWLPQVREGMIKTQVTGSVANNLSWFYILGIAIPLIIFLYSLGNYILLKGGIMYCLVFILIGGILLLFVLDKIRYFSKEDSLQKQQAKSVFNFKNRSRNQFILAGFLIYLAGYVLINFDGLFLQSEFKPQTVVLRSSYDYLAPDKSEIRLLITMHGGGLAHCVLPPRSVTNAVEHKTVEEIWYVLSGTGELWRKNGSAENVVALQPQTSVSIPLHTQFQFRNTGSDSLKLLIATMPPWPGKEEAMRVSDFWPVP